MRQFSGVLGIAVLAAAAMVALRARGIRCAEPRPDRPEASLVSTAVCPLPSSPRTVDASSAPEAAPAGDVEPSEQAADPPALGRLLSRDGVADRDAAAVDLMNERAGEAVPTLEDAFRKETDVAQRLRLLHVLLAQHNRYGAPFAIDGEALPFLDAVLSDPETADSHGIALGALVRRGTPEAWDRVREAMLHPAVPSDLTSAIEALRDAPSREAAEVALDVFRHSTDVRDRIALAGLLVGMQGERADAALKAAISGEVRTDLDRMRGAVPDEWHIEALSGVIEEIDLLP